MESRIVIDSNVWISALVFGGAPRRVFETVIEAGIRVAISEEIIEEVRRVVSVKFPTFGDDLEAMLTVLSDYLHFVQLGSLRLEVSRDPDDDLVLEAAILAKAPTIVTGDKDLLSLSEYQGVRMLNPGDWLKSRSNAAQYE